MKLTARLMLIMVLPIMLFFQAPEAAAAEPIRVFVNDIELVFHDTGPFTDSNGRTLVPVRVVAEAMGCDVDWDSATNTVILTRGRLVAELTIGKKEVSVLGARRTMNTAAIIRDRRTFVPVRFVAEAFGAVVIWENDTRTVRITDDESEIYRLGEFVWDIEETDTFEGNSDGFLTIIKESGLVLDERRVGDDQSAVMVIGITVDIPGKDIKKQREEADALLRQRIDSDIVDEIMKYIAAKDDEATVIERKYFRSGEYRIYATGYIGPIELYIYL